MKHQIMEFLTVGIPSLVAAFISWVIGARNDGTSRENVYADHTKEMWERMDELNAKLDRVTQERDDLKEQLRAMRQQVRTLQGSINQMKKMMEESKNEQRK
ncbi:hypothetical protein [Levilactobacillus sp. N40-8-2]|uniref:hypothetical protein n=1 Tax=Levilactobacillus muriae TaxID=3238987 RepID=UPI0038B3B4EA